MQYEVFDLLNCLLSTITGGLITLVGMNITQKFQLQKEKERWKRDKQYVALSGLIGILDSIDIQIKVDANIQTDETKVYADADYFSKKLNEINTYIESNKATLFIFMPTEIYSRLIKLNCKIYKIISNEQTQTIDFGDFYNSTAFKLVAEAKGIADQIKNEILK